MLKIKYLSALLSLTLLTGCSILPTLIPPIASFGLGLYDADTYYSKECSWYEPSWFSKETKEWIRTNNPDQFVLTDLAKVARNNDIFKEVCDASD